MFKYQSCDRCDGPCDEPETPYGEFLCASCLDNDAESAWEAHQASFHDGGSTRWPDAERVRMEESRRLK